MSTTLANSLNDQKKAAQDFASRLVTNELKKLGRHCSHYLTGILISLLVGFVSFPIFTRLFSVSDYGTIDLLAKLLLLLIALSKMGLQQSALRFYDGNGFSSDSTAAQRYYTTMLGGIALSATCVMLLYCALVGVVPRSLIDRSLASLLLLVSTLILTRAITSVLWVFLRVQEKTKLFAIFMVATKVGTVAAVLLLIPVWGHTVRTFYSGTIAVEVVLVIILGVLLLRGGLLRLRTFDTALLRSGLAFGLPLIAYELAGITLDASDRVLVRHFLGPHTLGLYSLAYGMSDYVNNLLLAPINLALVPIYMRLWTNEGKAATSDFLSRGLDLFFMASSGLIAVVAATSRDAVILFASAKYRGAEALIPTLVAGLLLYTTHAFLSAGLMINKDSRTMARLLAYSAVFNVVLNVVLLPKVGVQAAAFSTLFSYLFCVILLARASHEQLPLAIDFPAAGKYVLGAIAAWYAAMHVNLAQPLADLTTRTTIVVGVYSIMLYAMGARIQVASGLFDRRRRSADYPA